MLKSELNQYLAELRKARALVSESFDIVAKIERRLPDQFYHPEVKETKDEMFYIFHTIRKTLEAFESTQIVMRCIPTETAEPQQKED